MMRYYLNVQFQGQSVNYKNYIRKCCHISYIFSYLPKKERTCVVRSYHATLPSFGGNKQGSNNDGTVQQADNNSNCHYFSQSKATLTKIAAKYVAPATYNHVIITVYVHKVCYCPLLRVYAECLS